MLPRVLDALSKGTRSEDSNIQARAIERLMESVGFGDDGDEQAGADGHDAGTAGWESLLQELQDCKEMSFAEINAKRKQLTFVAFSDPALPAKATILDSIVMPNVELMHSLFVRSGTIEELYHLPKTEKEKRLELMERLDWGP